MIERLEHGAGSHLVGQACDSEATLPIRLPWPVAASVILALSGTLWWGAIRLGGTLLG